ncbi:MAG: ComF family protein [Ectothiorhodospiraceae bacterium]|nr:ComF family protein [Ectothiorhodospiraceae bacterium]
MDETKTKASLSLGGRERGERGSLLHALLERLYPPRCLLCGAPGQAGLDLCAGCLADLPRARHACPNCAAPVPAEGVVCGRCLRRPPRFDAALAAFRYDEPLVGLVTGLKFHARLAHGRLLGALLAEAVRAADVPIPDCILPVPLHPQRLRERGFNQALEIARPLARAFDRPLILHEVRRSRPTRPQMALDARARRGNVRGAFAIRPGFAPASVALVDDVMTTGSTLDELARVFRRAGVGYISVWVAARA